MFKNNKIINILFLFLVVIFLISILSYYLSFTFISQDDLDIKCSSFIDLFTKPHNAHFISSFFSRLFAVFIPMKLCMHPYVFKSNYFCYIEALFILSFSFIISGFFYLNKKTDIFYPVTILFSTVLIFYLLKPQFFLLLFLYDGFFRMLMPAFLFLLLFYRLLKDLYIKDDNFYNQIFIGIMIFVCCISNEMISVSVIFGLIFYLIVNIKKINISLFINCIIVPFTALNLYLKAGAFIRHSDISIFCSEYFLSLMSYIPKFSLAYIKYVFINHGILHLLLISQIIILLFHKNTEYEKIKIETIKYIICFNLGILVFFASLITLGYTYYTEGQFWIVHTDIHVMYNIILCGFNIALLNLLIKIRVLKENIVNIFILIITVFLSVNVFDYYKKGINYSKQLLVDAYKTEKTILLANLKNKTAYIDKDMLSKSFNYWGYWLTPSDKEENKIYSTSSFIIFMNQFDFIRKIKINYMFTDKETADREFKANGGTFTKEELEKIDFGRLTYEDFLLNKKH